MLGSVSAAGPDDAHMTAWALAAGHGDRDAAAAFVAATQQHVRRFLTRLTGPREAEDLTQETYVRAMRNPPSFAARSSARTWLFAIARRVAIDHLRAASVRPRTAGLEDWRATVDTTSAERGSRVEDAVVLQALLAELPAERREAFIATQVLGLSYAEAAHVCGCPVGTIRSRVARARADLVAAMGADGHHRTLQRVS